MIPNGPPIHGEEVQGGFCFDPSRATPFSINGTLVRHGTRENDGLELLRLKKFQDNSLWHFHVPVL